MTVLFLLIFSGLTPMQAHADDFQCSDTRLRDSGFRISITGFGTKTPQIDLSVPMSKNRIESFEGICHQVLSPDTPRLECQVSTSAGNYSIYISGDTEKTAVIEKRDSTLEPLRLKCEL